MIKESQSRRTGVMGLSLALALALCLMVTASASAAVQHWHVGGTIVGESPVETVGSNEGSFEFGYTVGGVKLTTKCSSASTGGSISNPAGGGAGLLTNGSLVLSGCVVTVPAGKGCEAGSEKNGVYQKGTITFETLQGTALDQGAIRYEPQTGETLFVFSVRNCATAGLNGNKTMKGTITAAASSTSPGTYEFTTTSGSSITWGGNPASLLGKYKLTSKSGELVTLAP